MLIYNNYLLTTQAIHILGLFIVFYYIYFVKLFLYLVVHVIFDNKSKIGI